MKAYLYKTTKNNKDFICSKFDNSNERVTIFHDNKGIFQQYWQQGKVLYENKIPTELLNTTPSGAMQSSYNVGVK